MATQRDQFLEHARRLSEIVGDWVPPLTPALQAQAFDALDGIISRSADDMAITQLDMNHIDWSCKSTYNPGMVVMQLSRYHMLVPLAAAYRDTGEERYARSARAYIEAFLRDHPMPNGWEPEPYDGATQYDLRVGCAENAGWLGTLPVFLASPAFDDDFFAAMIAAVRAKLIYLSNNIYPDRNIRILHGETLLTNSLRLPFLPEADGWREQGVRILNDAVRRQVLSDGAHKEAVPGYHGGVKGMLTYVWQLAQALPELGLEIPSDLIAGMYDYTVAASRPDGELISLGDTRYTPYKATSSDHARKARAEFRAKAGLPACDPPLCGHFPVAGQVFLRDSWEPDATYLTFDATTRRSWHWHPGRNAITLFAHGRPLLIDTGYPFQNEEFPSYGTRTAHHSTCNLNGWNQSHSVAQLTVRQAPGYDVIEGAYDGGYWPMGDGYCHGAGIFGEHHRTLLWIHGRCLVALDYLFMTSEDGRKPSVESVWQFSEGPLTVDAAQRRAVTGHEDGNLLMLFPLMPDGTEISRHEGERDPMRGWVPIEWGFRCIPAPMVRLHAESHDLWHAHLATVLIPFAGTAQPQVTATATPPGTDFGGRDAGMLELRWEDGTRDRIIWIRRLENAINRRHGVDTDASLVHLCFDAEDRLVQGLAVDAGYLTCETLGAGDLMQHIQRC